MKSKDKMTMKSITNRIQCEDALWLRFLTEIDGTIPDAPPELMANPEVRKALKMVEASALTPEERAKYDGFQDWLCRETRRANAEREAEKIPALKAKLDAAVEKLRQTARNLKAMNLTNEQIAAATGLTDDEIAAL